MTVGGTDTITSCITTANHNHIFAGGKNIFIQSQEYRVLFYFAVLKNPSQNKFLSDPGPVLEDPWESWNRHSKRWHEIHASVH